MEIADLVKEGGTIALSAVLFFLLLRAYNIVDRKDEVIHKLYSAHIEKIETATKQLADNSAVLAEMKEALYDLHKAALRSKE